MYQFSLFCQLTFPKRHLSTNFPSVTMENWPRALCLSRFPWPAVGMASIGQLRLTIIKFGGIQYNTICTWTWISVCSKLDFRTSSSFNEFVLIVIVLTNLYVQQYAKLNHEILVDKQICSIGLVKLKEYLVIFNTL